MHRALLIPLVNWDSLIEIPALLKDGGYVVDVFCAAGTWAIRNSQYDKWIEASAAPESFTDELLKYIEQTNGLYDWIIPGDDVIIRILNEQITDESLFYKIMPLTKIENRELLGSKAGFSSLCAKYEIKTPAFLIYQNGMTVKDIMEKIKFPFLLKVDKSEGGFGIFMCESEKDLTESLGKIKDKTNIVFQQFIKGYDVNVEVLYRNGVLLVYNYSRTTRILGKFGVSTERLFYENTDIEPELIKIGERLGINGFGNVVFMYNELDNQHYLIEADVRPNAWMYYGKFTGHNFSEAIRNMIDGNLSLIRPKNVAPTRKIKINLYKKDVHRCIQEKDLAGLWAWATNADGRWRYIPAYDKKLLSACNDFLFSFFKFMVGARINKILKRKTSDFIWPKTA